MTDDNHNDTFPEAAIAVIGLAGRFPGASDVGALWGNIRAGRETVTFFDDDALSAAGVDAKQLRDPRYVKARAVLDGVELFDAGFFGFNPREAEVLDPQHRVFLECAWHALEDAGIDPDRHGGAIGVFASAGSNAYFVNNLHGQAVLADPISAYNAMIGNDKDFLSTRVSYKLNLRGPSVTVQTACSSSLVAVHLAVQSLLAGESDVALAGGVSLQFPHRVGYLALEGMILAPDGHCRAFDADARGTVPGNGAGVVVLKRLAEAVAEGDHIHAVIRGSAINNDGSLKVGYTAPSMEGQASAIAEALAIGDVEPRSVGYIETHGTGTELGDPIEIAALTQVYRASTEDRGYCAIGSLKSNMGHLDAAAGIAGLIKAVLALSHQELPPSLHFKRPNPQIDFAASPFYVNTELKPWTSDGKRRAAVSSFGIGGTNAHVVLEEAPVAVTAEVDSRPALLVVSARSEDAVHQSLSLLADHLEVSAETPLADVAYTLQTGRSRFAHRRFVVASDHASAVAALRSGKVAGGREDRRSRPIVFLFPGQGAQHAGMSAELYASEPLVKETIDAGAEILRPLLGRDIRELLHAQGAAKAAADEALRQTGSTQPALFLVEYALARFLMERGIEPSAMIGHSIGEYVAACVAEVFSFEDALKLVAARGQMMAALPSGSMLAIALPAEEVESLIGGRGDLALAAVNAPSLVTVSGSIAAIDALEDEIWTKNMPPRRLVTSHAFHSAMMDPVLETFTEAVRRVGPKSPRRPYISNTSGTWITEAEATDPGYYARHLRHTVRFADGLATLCADSERILLEVGPGQTLCSLAKMQAAKPVPINCLPHPSDPHSEAGFFAQALGRLWVAGAEIDFAKFHRPGRSRVSLPNYPFERQRFFIDAADAKALARAIGPAVKREDPGDWFAVPSWRRSLRLAPVATIGADAGTTVVFADGGGLATRLAKRLRALGSEVVVASVGQAFAKQDVAEYVLDLRDATQLDALLKDVRGLDRELTGVVYLRSLDEPAGEGGARFDAATNHGFFGFAALAQALTRLSPLPELKIAIVTAGAFEVTGVETLTPECATILGAAKVLPQEVPSFVTRVIDLERGSDAESKLHVLLGELRDPRGGEVVAHRAGHRWERGYEAVHLPPATAAEAGLESGGVYVISGPPDGLPFELAKLLVAECGARIVFLDPQPMPPRNEWDAWMWAHPPTDPTSRRISHMGWLDSRRAGAKVVNVDLGDATTLTSTLQAVKAEFGALNGIFHTVGFGGESVASALQQLAPADCAELFRVKAHAMYAIEQAVRAVGEVDFVAVQSSLACVLGGVGFAAYAGVNHFLDAFVIARSRDAKTRWLTLDWNNWKFGDDDADQDSFLLSRLSALAVLPAEGLDVLRRTLASGATQVIVTTATIESRFAEMKLKPGSGDDAEGHARPNLDTGFTAPRNDAERTIAEIWQSILGIDKVGVDDSFFDLGGHSLLAIQLVSRLREAFEVSVSLRSLFEAPTVAGLATLVTGVSVDDDLDALLREVEGMSEEDLKRQLEESAGGEAGQ